MATSVLARCAAVKHNLAEMQGKSNVTGGGAKGTTFPEKVTTVTRSWPPKKRSLCAEYHGDQQALGKYLLNCLHDTPTFPGARVQENCSLNVDTGKIQKELGEWGWGRQGFAHTPTSCSRNTWPYLERRSVATSTGARDAAEHPTAQGHSPTQRIIEPQI